MANFRKLADVIFKCFSIGDTLVDKLVLVRLYLSYPLANRGLYSYNNKIRNCAIKINQQTRKVFLRDNGTDILIFQSIFMLGEYAPPTKIESNSLTIYDLGSNIGLSAIWFSCVFPNCLIYGFEPVEENYQIASLNYQSINGQVFPIAIGKESGITKMLIDRDNAGSHRLSKHGSHPDSHIVREIDVRLESLQNFINAQKIQPPEFLKIDAEGSELDILYGLGDFIKSSSYIVIEPDKVNFQECVEFLKENHFKVYHTKPYLIWGVK